MSEYDECYSADFKQREQALKAFLTHQLQQPGSEAQAIAQCAAAAGLTEFFHHHGLALFRLWTAKLSQPQRVEALYEQMIRLLFDANEPGKARQAVADYCFSLLLAEVLADDECGRYLIASMLQPKATSLPLVDAFAAEGYLRLESLEIRREGEAAIISFLNGETLHAEDGEFVRDLETAADIVALSAEIKTGVLRGGMVDHPKYAGRRVFCSGINLKKLHDSAISYSEFLIGREMGCINKLIHGVLRPGETTEIVKPWIAVVETFAIGGGMQMVLACDYVIGEEGCYVSLPAAKEGIIPGLSNLRLTTATSERFAKQVILHGRKVQSAEADADFIFDRVVAPEDIGQALAEAVTLMAAPAVPANKRMLVQAKEPLAAFQAYMQAFCQEQVIRMYAPDVKQKTGKFASRTEALVG